MNSKGKILVIDDDSDFLEFAQIILETNGYQVHTAQNAEDGLLLARETQPDVALVDAMMSYVLDGLNLTQTMRHDPQCSQIPIILISAIISAESDGLLPSGQQVDWDAFMSKPIAPQTLLDKIAELVPSRS